MSEPRAVGARSPLPALMLAVVTVAMWWALSPASRNDLVGGDEGYYATMARNLLADPRQWLGPSLTPLGPPGDKPPLYPGLIAVMIRCFGFSEAAVRAVSFASALVVLGSLAALARRFVGGRAAVLAVALAGTLPWLADSSRVAASELPLTAFGMLALVVLTGPTITFRRGLAAGALFGLAFLCKLWLVALLGLPALAWGWPFHERRLWAGVGLGAALVGGAQLMAVQWLDPAQLDHWLKVYGLFSFADRAAGGGYAAFWLKGPEFYGVLLARAFILMLPLIGGGLAVSVSRFRDPGARLMLGWAVGLIVISAFAVKSGGYVYPLVPGFVLLAAAGARAYAERGCLARLMTVGLVALACVGGSVRIAQRLPQAYHDTGYAAIAAAIAPRLLPTERGVACVLAPEAPAFRAYLMRDVDYWDSPYQPWSAQRAAALAADPHLRAFVVDPTGRAYGGGPDAATLAWLEQHTLEITHSIRRRDGSPLEMRVFVRP